eukprot:GHRR01012944.1.p1 GENE.GHRR01012944.1~~GHRR01012944.1.p1  ORF type:complete len:247 (+),score=76.43 GHRR01012944.1:1828-2568(+)
MSMFDDYDGQQAKQVKAVVAQSSDSDSEESASDSEQEAESSESNDEQIADKLEDFLSGRKGSHRKPAAAAAGSASDRQLLEQQKAQQHQWLLEQKLKKKFMSSKVARIFEDIDSSQLGAAQADIEQNLTSEEFIKMKRDVELLGASALDKRSAKAWKASMLAKLGASAGKTPRTPAKIGHGMARKAKQREAVALQEAIASGMVQAKGRGKKLRALKAKQRDKGLMEAGKGWKNGVLRIGKLKPATS